MVPFLKEQLVFFKVDLFILREREREREKERERGREQVSMGGQRIRYRLCTDSREPDVGLKLTNHEIVT